MDARHPVRREWQALYGIGLVLAAFAAGEYLGEDGFLAAFAAGAAVSLSSKTLCDCFLEFGEVLAELLMLLSFVLFGAVLSTMLDDVAMGEALAARRRSRSCSSARSRSVACCRCATRTSAPQGARVHRLVRAARAELAAARAARRRARRRRGRGGLRDRGRRRARLGRRARRHRDPALRTGTRAASRPRRCPRSARARSSAAFGGRFGTGARRGAADHRRASSPTCSTGPTRRSCWTSARARATRATRSAFPGSVSVRPDEVAALGAGATRPSA